MSENKSVTFSNDILLARSSFRKIGNLMALLSFMTMAIMLVFPRGDMGLLRWDFVVWARTYPITLHFFFALGAFFIAGRYAYNMPLTLQSSTWELPDVILEKPRSISQVKKSLIQLLAVIAGLMMVYLGFLMMFLALFNLIHSKD